MKACGDRAARIASAATLTLPSVPFLKPTGELRPEASWRWLWLSVVRAPIAPQAIRSATYWGLSRSRNSVPVGRPAARQLQQKAARSLQALVDRETAVEMRVVDVALPADGRARLLEIGPHDDQEVVAQALGNGLQQAGVLERLVVVVDRARTDDDHQPVVRAVEHGGDRRPARLDQGEGRVVDRHALLQQCRSDQRPDGADPDVVDAGRVEGAVPAARFAVVEVVVEAGHGRAPYIGSLRRTRC